MLATNLTVPIPFQSPTAATLATPSPLLHLRAGRVDPRKVRLKEGAAPLPTKLGPPPRAALTCPWRAGSSPPRCGWTASCAWPSRVRGAGSAPEGAGPQGRVQPAGAGLGAAGDGPRRAREVSAGAGESLPLHSPPPPPHVRGPQRRGSPIGGRGSPWVGGAGSGRGAHWPPGGRGGACAQGCYPAGSPRAGGHSGVRARRSALGWPVPPVRVGGRRGPRVPVSRCKGATGPSMCSEAWAGDSRGGPPWPPEPGAWDTPRGCKMNECTIART